MASTSGNEENLAPGIVRKVAKEIRELATNPPEGIKVIPSEEDITDIQAVIQGPAGTPYAGGSFRVKLLLGKEFPQSPPKGYIITKIFHPNVARNGEICVNTLKKDWKPDLGIRHVLLVIKCLLIVPNPESALNEEAGKLLLEQYDSYCERARMMTDIHASSSSSSSNTGYLSLSKKHGLDEEAAGKSNATASMADKKKAKERKKMLKRL